MLSKCANPGCFANFRYLHEGRVFRLERGDPRIETIGEQVRSLEYFWLCERCSKSLKLVYERGCVTVHPVHLQLPASSLELGTVAVPQSA